MKAVRTITCCRRNAANKKPGKTFLLTLFIAGAFIAGGLVGSETSIIREAAAAGRAGLVHPAALCREYAAVIPPYLADSVGIVSGIAGRFFSGFDPDIRFITGP